jgi:translation initiation factor IF-3
LRACLWSCGFSWHISTTGGHISIETRINDRIRVPEVRLVGPAGEQVGIVKIEDALRLAFEADLDLVEVSPESKPPVCKLMDFGKFKYDAALKARESRKNQVNTVIKEMKLRPKIDSHEYETKKGHILRFLNAGDKVKITIMFRGREITHRNLGTAILDDVVGDLKDIAVVEQTPRLEGKQMFMILGPNNKVAQRARDAHRNSLLAAEKEKAERKGVDGAPSESAPGADEVEGAEAPEAAPPPPSPRRACRRTRWRGAAWRACAPAPRRCSALQPK